MTRATPALLVLVVACCVGPAHAFRDGPATLARVLDAIELGLVFMKNEHRQLNLDAIIGTRLVEGQLGVLVGRLGGFEGGLSVKEETAASIRRLRDEADRVSNIATPFIRSEQTEYYSRIGPIIDRRFWSLRYASRDVVPELITRRRYAGEVMHERQSDDCLTELFGSGKSNETCRVSRHCWIMMTSPGYRFYSLSHQVFYLQIGESFKCFTGRFLIFTDALNAGFCANMLIEAASIAKANYPPEKQDLFMEHQALCGVLGYRQFARRRWLEKILSWQSKDSGCWLDTFTDAGSRHKREEKDLEGGCGCHRTAVALAALTQYVRYVIEDMQR